MSHLVVQSEDALLATRLVLPPSPGGCAFLYNDELVYACSTGMARLAVPDERISFSSPGEKEMRRCLSIEQFLPESICYVYCNFQTIEST